MGHGSDAFGSRHSSDTVSAGGTGLNTFSMIRLVLISRRSLKINHADLTTDIIEWVGTDEMTS